MMLGIAASSSIATPIGRRSQGGESSVRNSAIPKLTGTPIASAIIDVTSVPMIGTSAPNSSVTGFQALLKKNPAPKRVMEGQLPTTSETMMPASSSRTPNAKLCVTSRNATSCRRSRAPI